MGNSWETVRLGDLIEIRGGFSYKGSFIGKGDSKLVGMGCVSFSERFLDNGCRNYGGEFPETHRLKPGDIVIATRQQSDNLPILGFPAIIPEYLEGRDVIVATNLYKLTNHSDIPNRFLYWLLRGAEYRNRILSCSKGTTVRMITKDAIEDFYFRCPPDDEIRKITDILDSFDDKIELNRRMNATLEGMAQALFKSWFVDFDPVIDNALAAGNPIPDELAPRAEVRKKALANGTANREAAKAFPAAFQFTEELGWIPEGWAAKQMGQMLRSVSDTYPLKTVDEIIFLNTGDILDGRFLHADYSATAGLPGQAKKSIQKHDILYSEIRPRNRRFAYVHIDGAQHVVSTKLMVLRATSEISSLFAYLILKQDSTIDHLQMLAESRSGTFPQITFDVLAGIQVALPPNLELVELFTDKVLKSTQEKQLQLDASTETLTKLRDTLLPKLISRELRIPECKPLLVL
ncbi:restriction endonuclease subunit S [Persicirhabdus sediminis]|uniref:Restriction endonuclease subunit S n=1 Tax=Persicirhabdus sediminis TaxID=454144 RepID=A0A8J7SJH6_9BACT|nr:restriction endonuclease subunit S [Persicirhabdus sediminis]MBK1791354.1 restriction endonuclease subunit S [Persicirhabdus sediminis]